MPAPTMATRSAPRGLNYNTRPVHGVLTVLLCLVASATCTAYRVLPSKTTYMYGINRGYNDVGSRDAAGQAPVGASFVQARGQQFVLDGKPVFVNGVNLYWLMTKGASPDTRHLVTDILRESASVGVTVVRTWAFADGDGDYNLQVRPGVYTEAIFRGLDFAVSEAKKVGIRLILSFVNNYADYGGKAQYVAWAQRYAGKWSAAGEDDFYSDDTIRGWYQNHVKAVITRVNTITGVAYRDEPAVFAWELMNEPRCSADTSGYVLQKWIREMAVFVKSLDRNHMLEVGLEGFYSAIVSPNSVSSESANPGSYSAQYGTDFILNSQPDEIDFATVHSYPDNWIPTYSEDRKRAFMGSWVSMHINDAKFRLNKPVLFAEFGKSDRAPGYTESMRVTAMTDMFDAVYASARDGGPAAGALVWQFVPSSLKSSLSDGYEIVLSDSPAISSLMRNQASRLSDL